MPCVVLFGLLYHLHVAVRNLKPHQLHSMSSFGDASIFLQAGQGGDAAREKVDRVCAMINGDIRSTGRIIHYERACGRCKTRDDALKNCAAALAEIMPPPGATEPSKNRWGHLDIAMSEQAPMLLLHQIGSRAQRLAFPRFDAIQGSSEADEDSDFRAWMHSKVLRSTRCLSCPQWRCTMLTTLWVSRPCHWLWLRLEHIDAAGAGLLDVVVPSTSPFIAVQRQFLKMLTQAPSETHLKALFFHFDNEPHLLERAPPPASLSLSFGSVDG